MILDSSALIALLRGEEGADIVAAHARGARILTVNMVEVIQRMLTLNVGSEVVLRQQVRLEVEAVPFTMQHAIIAATLREATRHKGLALGDRACLALAIAEKQPVLTADGAWTEVDVGADVRLIR